MLKNIFKYEAKLLRSDGMAGLTILLFLGAMAYAGWIGLRYTDEQEAEKQAQFENFEDQVAQMQQEAIEQEEQMVEEGVSLDTYTFGPRSPYTVGSSQGAFVASPVQPFAAFSIGQSDLQPAVLKVTVAGVRPAGRTATLENPFKLLVGHFDFAFVFLYIYPLLIIALTFGLTSAERESGLLRMLLAQPLRLSTLAVGKISVRALILGGSVILGSGVLAFLLRAEGTGLSWGLWVIVSFVYGAFWLGLAVFVDSRLKTAATSALALSGCWLVLAIVVPALISFFSTVLYPVPSRMEYIAAMRTETTVAQQQGSASLARFFEDHPEIAPVSDDEANFSMLRVAQEERIAEQLAPLEARFNEQRSKQQAFINRIGYLSPTVLVHQAYMEIAGTGSTQYALFQEEVAVFQQAWKSHMVPKYFEDVAFRAADYDALPSFEATQRDTGDLLGRLTPSTAFILFLSVLLFGFGFSRYRSQSLIA